MHASHSSLSKDELERRRYAFPDTRKFPLPDRKHVLSAIKFFNYVEPRNEKALADAILKRMRELNMTDVNVGEGNRFRKYYNKEPAILHSGIAYRLTFKDGTSAYLT